MNGVIFLVGKKRAMFLLCLFLEGFGKTERMRLEAVECADANFDDSHGGGKLLGWLIALSWMLCSHNNKTN